MNNLCKIFVSITLIILMYPSVAVNAQRYNWNMHCVEQFTVGVSTWLKTNDGAHRTSAENACSKKPAIRVADELVNYLGTRNNRMGLNGSYDLETFLNLLKKEDSKNHVSLTYSKPAFVSPNKINNPNAKVDHYVCDVELLIGNDVYKKSKNLFYVVDGKVARIAKYTVSVSNNKVTVDYDDFINDYETTGFSYNYGQYFPIGGSFNYSFEDIPFMLSFDFGVNLDGDKYIVEKVSMTNIMNYKREKKIMDPKFFLTITPQLYFKYFAVGCGVGFLYMDGTTDTDYSTISSSSTGGGSISVSTSTSYRSSSSTTDEMLKPMIRPVMKGFIPLTDELYLSLSVGYDMIFGYKDKNGFNVGLGLQWEL